MCPSDRATFDLIHEPWIRVCDLEGVLAEYGVLRTLEQAHRLAGLSGDVPTQTFALTRMLLAVLHGALQGPRDDGQWQELWEAPELPVARIAGYLASHSDRFDLFSSAAPFYQVADLHTAKGETSELSKLIADVPNGVPFFTTRLGGELSLSYAEAARWVVHCQAFDCSGIKSGAVGDARVKNGKGYSIGVAWSGRLGGVLLEGRTLKETLLLNLPAHDFGAVARDPTSDLPAWEREPVGAAEEVEGGRPATGPVDLYTWQSRRIRLVPSSGRVGHVLICNGERLSPQNMQDLEPHTAWRRSAAQEKKLGRPLVYMPREHDPVRPIWCGLPALLPCGASHQTGQAATAPAPGVLEWLGHLDLEHRIAQDFPVRVRAIGMIYGSQSSVTDDIVDDSLALPAVLARQDAQDLAQIAISCVEAAEKAARALGGLGGDLVVAAGGEGAGPRSRAIERVNAELDVPFRRWLSDLHADCDTEAVQTDWHETVFAMVGRAAEELLATVASASWQGRPVRGRILTAAHAEARFGAELRAALPSTSPPSAGCDTAMTSRLEDFVADTPADVPLSAPSGAASWPPLGRVGAFVDVQITGLQHRVLGVPRDPTAVAALARLRRGAGTQPGELLDILECTLPDEFRPDPRDGVPSSQENAAHVAMTLFGLHQQSHGEPMHRRGRGLGSALRASHKGYPKAVPEQIRRRFCIIGTADSFTELAHRLRDVVQLLRARGVPVDYGLLADQFVAWQRPGGSDRVRLRWWREFYRTERPPAEASATAVAC